MKLSTKQHLFTRNLNKLLTYILGMGYDVSIGEAQRTTAQQEAYVKTGRSKTMNSQHLKKLAVDLFIFDTDGNVIWDKDTLQHIGDYWEQFNENNQWGGNWNSFKDIPHFEMKD